MIPNPILDELHAARQKLLNDVEGDIHKYIQEARDRALSSERKVISSTLKDQVVEQVNLHSQPKT